jgi:hypothetical protein
MRNLLWDLFLLALIVVLSVAALGIMIGWTLYRYVIDT